MDAINLVVLAWTINMQQEAIANLFGRIICSANRTGSSHLNDANSGEDVRELDNIITCMHSDTKWMLLNC